MTNRYLQPLNAVLTFALIAIALIAAMPVVAEDTTPPLPFHTIEGYGGGAITPFAYLVNPAPSEAGSAFGNPAFAISTVGLGKKNLDALTVSETINERLELSFGADRLGLGTLPAAIRTATGVDIAHSDVSLYNLNARYLVIKEGKNNPAITAGIHYKNNPDINEIDKSLGGALKGIGLDGGSGIDATITATKFFANVGGNPLIVSAQYRSKVIKEMV